MVITAFGVKSFDPFYIRLCVIKADSVLLKFILVFVFLIVSRF